MGPQPRLFHYSLDWRFLLPLADPKKIYLFLEEDQDFSSAIQQVGIDASQQLSFSELQQKMDNDIQSFVMPFGIPVRWVNAKDEDQVAFYASTRRLISSDGCLLIGFTNAWGFRRNSQQTYHSSTPRRIIKQLRRAGFPSITIFGAMPNLAIPEYIFDLDFRTAQFALQNRFRRKPAVLRTLQGLSGVIGWKRISNFLPCYFVVATA